MNKLAIILHKNLEKQAASLVQTISEVLLEEIAANGFATLILPGGSSPKALIARLAQKDLPWEKIKITTTDERCVGIESEHSNIGQIIRLLAAQGISAATTSLWDNEAQEMIKNADIIEALELSASVTVLGMGEDGHIASLFPGQEWEEGASLTLKAQAPSEPKNRVSLSMDALISSKQLILLVNGEEKWRLCQKILSDNDNTLPLGQLFNLAHDKLNIHTFI